MKKTSSLIAIIGILFLFLSISISADVIPTTEWTSFFGEITYNDQPAPVGTIVDAYDPDGILCGSFTVKEEGWFGLLNVYGDDAITDTIDEGANTGDIITLMVNNREVVIDSGDIIWQSKVLPKQINISSSAAVAFSLIDFEDVKTGEPGETVRFEIGVQNDGTGLDFYQIDPVSSSNWNIPETSGFVYALPYDTAYVYFDIVVPLAPSPFIDTITFTVSSPLDATQQVEKAYIIKQFDGGIDIYDFEVIAIPSDTSGSPDETIELNIEIQNLGITSDSYSLTINQFSDWTITQQALVSILPGQTDYLKFYVTIPNDFTVLENNIDYTIESIGDPTKIYENSVLVAVIPNPVSVLTVVDPPNNQNGVPGETVRFLIGTKNDGTTSDLYTVTAASAKDWNITSQDSIFNTPGNTEYVYFDVEVPLHIGTLTDTITYTVSSYIDPTQFYTSTVELVSSSDIFVAFTIIEPAVNKAGFPGDTITFSVKVRNDGNSTDIYRMSTQSMKNWETIDDNMVFTSPGFISEVSFSVIIPEAIDATYDVLDYTLASIVDPSKTYSGKVILTSSQQEIFIMSVLSEPDDQHATPGSTARYTMTVRNDGNAADLYSLVTTSASGWMTTDSSAISNEPGETIKIYFDVEVPAEATNGMVDDVFFRLVSINDETQFLEGYVYTTVDDNANVVLNAFLSPVEQSAYPGDIVRFTIGATNEGNSTDIYKLTSSSSLGWLTVNTDSTFISPGDTQYVSFDVYVPVNAGDVEDIISFRLESYIDPAQYHEGVVKLTSSRRGFVALTMVDYPLDQSGAPGGTARFSFTIRNDGNAQDIYGITATTALGWTITTLDNISNEPSQTAALYFDVTIPSTALNIVETVIFRVFSQIDANEYFEDTLTLSILPTDVEDGNGIDIPDNFAVSQNYPNPFNPSTTIEYALPQKSEVRLDIINILGQFVETKNLGYQAAGYHTIDFDGSALSSGIYFYRIITDFGVESKKMVLLK